MSQAIDPTDTSLLGAFPKVVQDDMIAWHQHAEQDIGKEG